MNERHGDEECEHGELARVDASDIGDEMTAIFYVERGPIIMIS